MGFLFGRKKQRKQEAAAVISDEQTERFSRQAPDPEIEEMLRRAIPDYDLSQRQMRETEKFERSDAGKTLKLHFEMTERLRMAPASKQEAIALDHIAFAKKSARALMEDAQIRERHAKERGWEGRPATLPTHLGFQRLAINYERDKRFDEAIKVCQAAKDQGWNGDWDKRIERVRLKASKQT